MAIKTVNQLITQMLKDGAIDERIPWNWSWGTREYCAGLFRFIFTSTDGTMTEYKHLPEYDQIIDWMTNTNDKGLLLIGDCGRGKSIILNYVLPVLFRMKGRGFKPAHAQDLYKDFPRQNSYGYYSRPLTYLDVLETEKFPAVDELGIEGQFNDYGERTEGFNLLLNSAVRYHKPVFVSTNLTEEQILNRYRERTLDRLQHLRTVVHFKGESLRK